VIRFYAPFASRVSTVKSLHSPKGRSLSNDSLRPMESPLAAPRLSGVSFSGFGCFGSFSCKHIRWRCLANTRVGPVLSVDYSLFQLSCSFFHFLSFATATMVIDFFSSHKDPSWSAESLRLPQDTLAPLWCLNPDKPTFTPALSPL